MNTLEKVQISQIKNQAERARLHEYLHQQLSVLSSKLDVQFKEEDYKGTSNKQYEYAMLNYAFRIASILSILTRFKSYSQLETTYNLKEIANVLAKRGISFNEILHIYSIPVKELDNRLVGTIQVGNSPITELPERPITTIGNSEVSSSVIVVDTEVSVFAAYSNNSDGSEYEGELEVIENRLYGITITFPDFENMYPVILSNATLTIDSIVENGTNIKSQFTQYGNTIIEGVVYDIWVLNTRAVSALDDEHQLTVYYNEQ